MNRPTRSQESVVVMVVCGSCMLGACYEGRADREAATITDSAGVTLVVNHAPTWEEGEAWTIDPEPIVDLTRDWPGPERDFFRVSDVKVAPDGRIAVADGGANEIRVFAPDGGYLETVGGPGQGPGEFRFLIQIWWEEEKLWALDFSAGRATRFRVPGGAVDTEVSLPSESGVPWGTTVQLSDGSLAGRTGFSSSQITDDMRGRVVRPRTPLLRRTPGAAGLDTLRIVPLEEFYVWEPGYQLAMGAPLVGRRTALQTHPDGLVLGTAEGMAYEVLTEDGSTARRVSVPAYDLGGAEELYEAAIQARLAGSADPQSRAAFEEAWRQVPVPEERPGYGTLKVGPAGDVWASEFATGTPSFWEIFDRDGRWLGRVRVPEGFTVVDVGDEWIAGYSRDDLDVQHVQVVRIVKP